MGTGTFVRCSLTSHLHTA